MVENTLGLPYPRPVNDGVRVVSLRITKTLCPSCEGTGKFRSLDFPCMWCRGEKRLPVEKTKQYADQMWMLAGGGYIAGDHDLKEMREMEAKAEGIYELIGEKSPWKDKANV